jgi:hypothetical protein
MDLLFSLTSLFSAIIAAAAAIVAGQAVSLHKTARAERKLAVQLGYLSRSQLMQIREEIARTSSRSDRLAICDKLIADYVDLAMKALGEDERRRVLKGFEQPSAVGRVHYAQKILDESLTEAPGQKIRAFAS